MITMSSSTQPAAARSQTAAADPTQAILATPALQPETPVPVLAPALASLERIRLACAALRSDRRAPAVLFARLHQLLDKLHQQHSAGNPGTDSNVRHLLALASDMAAVVGHHAAKTPLRQLLAHKQFADKLAVFDYQLTQLCRSLWITVVDDFSLTKCFRQDTADLTAALDAAAAQPLPNTQKIETLADIDRALRSNFADFPAALQPTLRSVALAFQNTITKQTARSLVQHREWMVASDDVDIAFDRVITKGILGMVYHAVWSGRESIVKFIAPASSQAAIETIHREASLWFQLDHPNVMRVFGVCLNTDMPFIVLPMMQSDLITHLDKNPNVDVLTRLNWMRAVAIDINSMHDRPEPVVHGSIGLNNVLIASNGKIQAAEFDRVLLASLGIPPPDDGSLAGTWFAPEVLNRSSPATPASDVFAYAMTCFHLFVGLPPFVGESELIIEEYTRSGTRPPRPDDAPEDVWALLTDCWAQDPARRPSLAQVVVRLDALIQAHPAAVPQSVIPKSRAKAGQDRLAFSPTPEQRTLHAGDVTDPTLAALRANLAAFAAPSANGSTAYAVSNSGLEDATSAAGVGTALTHDAIADMLSRTSMRDQQSIPDKPLSPAAASGVEIVVPQTSSRSPSPKPPAPPASTPPAPAQAEEILGPNDSQLEVLFGSFPEWARKNGVTRRNIVQRRTARVWDFQSSAWQEKPQVAWNSEGAITELLLELVELDLCKNQLEGSIPAQLSKLRNLENLSLSWNDLGGPIPTALGLMANLRHIWLNVNQFSGSIPRELGSLRNLTILDLRVNWLTGRIPPELGSLTNLVILRLDNNQLEGEIPKELGNLIRLTHLELHTNQLTGAIPVELAQLTNLTVLNLSDNNFSGPIPDVVVTSLTKASM
nr:hypothetical protein HK105_007827 [Polyrhizophydium stewartii]